jgi:hypothetical protein
MKHRVLALTLMIGVISVLCESGWAQGGIDTTIAEMISQVSDSAMHQTISDLQAFGTRYTYASTRDTVARWIKTRFLETGIVDVYLDAFTLSNSVYNVVATIPGNSPTGAEMVIGAHYDSYSQTPMSFAPGADDDASGTSAVIELARVISACGYKPQLTLRFIAFTGEEQGLLGSYDYAQRAWNAGSDIRAMLNFDQIGNRNVGDRSVRMMWHVGGEQLATLATAVIPQYTWLTPYQIAASNPTTDSYSFAHMGYPSIWWFESTNTPFWHTTHDLVDYVDISYAAEIARSALAFLITFDKSTEDVQPVSETLPTAVHLYQNYPNPFNPSTTIKYELPKASQVTLSVFDILGREVSVLANERKNAGVHEVKFDGSNLASGVYIYRMQAGDLVEAKKLILLK